MEKAIGPSSREKWGLQESDHGFFDSLMTMVSNPVSTNYGLHDDGKTGLCTPDEFVEGRAVPNKYSKFNIWWYPPWPSKIIRKNPLKFCFSRRTIPTQRIP